MTTQRSRLPEGTLPPGTLLLGGRYRVDRLLGRGSQGEVYAVTSLPAEGRSAIKVVRRRMRSGGRAIDLGWIEERLVREATLSSKVHGSSERDVRVLRVYDMEQDADALYGKMDLAARGSLAGLMAERAARGEMVADDEARRWLLDAARGLRSLHIQGAIHADVKPGNVLLMDDGGAVIADLGSAQLGGDTVDMSRRMYSPDYGSPEHRQPVHLIPAADVYSLGCVAYELLAGERWACVREQGAPLALLQQRRVETWGWWRDGLEPMLRERLDPADGRGAAPSAYWATMEEVIAWLEDAAAARAGGRAAVTDGRRTDATPAAAKDEVDESALRTAPPEPSDLDADARMEAALDQLDAGDGDGALKLLTGLRESGYRSPGDDLDALMAEAERLVAEARAREEAAAEAAAREAAGRAAYAHVVRLSKRSATRELGRAAWERYLAAYPERDDPEGMAAVYPLAATGGAAEVSPTAEQQALLDAMLDFSRPPTKRAEAGRKLASLGDPRPGVGLRPDGVPDIAWVEVPSGAFRMGDDDEPPSKGAWAAQRTVDVPGFWMGRYTTTWAQYEAFLTADDGYGNEAWWKGLAAREAKPGKQRWPLSNHPAENVSWYDAVAYTRWLSARLGYEVRLPAEAEWEKAARGTDGRRYPWGDVYEEGRANIDEGWPPHRPVGTTYLRKTTAVGQYLQNNPYTLEDMAGNVWEWTLTDSITGASDSLDGASPRVVRGGSWPDCHGSARAAIRYGLDPGYRINDLGFRVVSSAPPRL